MTNPSIPLLYYSARYRLGTARLGPFITMRGAASVPLGPSITMRGTASVPPRYRSGPLLQCAAPPRFRFGTARALCYNARRRHHLKLPSDINFLAPLACENCKQLVFVDLSSTLINAILGSTFSRCVNLAHIWFPPKLRRIGKEGFMFCTALQEVHTPPALQYIAHKAFSTVDSSLDLQR